jgi:hypothetical protein
LGGVSLNHLLHFLEKTPKIALVENRRLCDRYFLICFSYCDKEFQNDFILLNDRNQALNIFGHSEEFQREFYEAIQAIKNINNK